MRWVARWVVAIAIGGASTIAFAQHVREDFRFPSATIRSANKMSLETPINWPTLDVGTVGILIIVSGDYYNSDLDIITQRTYGKDKLLRLSKKLAAEFGRPQSDFIVRTGRRLLAVDTEFNKFVRKVGNVSEADIPVGTAMRLIEGSDLPRPLGLFVRVGKGDLVTLDGTILKDSAVFDPRKIPTRATAVFKVERHWYGLLGLGMLGVLTFAMIAFFAFTTVKSWKNPYPAAKSVPEGPLSLVEAQSKYDALRKGRVIRFLPLLPVILIGSSVLMRSSFDDAGNWLPPEVGTRIAAYLIPLSIALVLISMAVRAIARRRIPRPAGLPDHESSQFAPLRWIMAGPAALTMLLGATLMFPGMIRQVPTTAFRVVLWSLVVGPLVAAIIASRIASRRVNERLTAGDPDYDYAVEVAKKADVKLRRMIVRKSKTVNAFATMFGIVGITSGAREKLSDEERRAVIAHEIGHVKAQHVPLILLASFVTNIGVIALLVGQDDWVKSHVPDAVYSVYRSPLLIWVILPLLAAVILAPFRKRAELSADRFALRTVGDYGVMARSLARIHLLNGAPHTRYGFDEFAASHPSLVRRLASLKKAAEELGMFVDPHATDELFQGGAPPVIVDASPVSEST